MRASNLEPRPAWHGEHLVSEGAIDTVDFRHSRAQ